MNQQVLLAQEAFRLFISALSYVGEVKQLPDSPQAVLPIGKYLYALTFLDQEVSYASLGLSEEQEAVLTHEFRTKKVAISVAQTVFVDLINQPSLDVSPIKQVSIGNLIDPQLSATIVVSVSQLYGDNTYILTGPGIKSQLTLGLTKALSELLVIRQELNQEYPLGIDMLVIDQSGKMLGLPRTTVIQEVN
ncbi:phosphonate C-P lyase system protein PhnH [Vagococcus penaei]|uniref:Phosphonate C-P lyase system protein PhnH n=1 Tax=Vagococcus penaei TaxID=633807 RepID=A0A1Q2D730_9ENTE|nr:phosphonate C-P lyase system protein PhnH [Vagococcus penaei]AQP54199.1 phosphonate C-P lyase system protein PhnH [Vagococcus penaei]RST99983.1 phosphonate C-P lyase system protein PhnH [Vagococcus penaei]